MLLHIDLETRNELDISTTGAYKYIDHPSCELLMFAYAWGDADVQLWECHKGPIPEDLLQGLQDPFQIIVAHNCQFERLAIKRFFDIDIPVDRFIDPMILSRAMSMPGKLEKVGKILDIKSKKLTEFFVKDVSMVDLFCKPLRFGGELTLFGIEPTSYRDWDTHVKEYSRFCDYCKTDVEAMREILHRLKDFPLPDWEYENFALSEEINDYGIYTDSVLLQGASIVVEKEQSALTKQFLELTGIKNPKSPVQVLAYARQNGYTFLSIGKPFIKRALNGECDLNEQCRKALELRLQLSKSSVSKLDAYRASIMSDGRVRGLFHFMGAARTGRMTSGLVQVQNLVKASKEVGGKFDLALSLLKSGDYEGIKKNFSSPLDVACAALRPILCAAPGKKFVIADLSAIEARGAGWVTECEPLLEVFRQGRDPYIAFAAQMDGHATYEELWETYKAGDKTARTNAKAPTLGCFGEDTMVLTNHGVKKIVNVTLEDKLWDGGEWVSHDGCVYQGDKKVINLLRVDVTPEHGILTEEGWKEACEVTQSGLYERSAINLASGLLPDSLRRLKNTSVTLADAGSAAPKNWSIGRILKRVRQVVASLVPEKRFRKTRTEYTSDFRNLENLLTGWRTGTTRFCRAAGESVLPLIATEDGGFSANLRMCTISSDTALPLRTMTSPRTRSTEKIMTAIMKKGIFDLLPQKLMGGIKKTFATSTIWEKNFLPLSSGKDTAPSTGSAETSAEKSTKDSLQKGSLQNSPNAGVPTFDILNSGPRSRFTILTEKGPLIVHNCGYGLSAGEETTDEEGNSVKTGLLAYAENMGIELTLEYAEKAVQVYRNTYREVEQYWYDLHRAFARVVENDTTAELGPIRLEMKGRVLCVWLPSGRALHYINPSVTWVDATSRKGNSYRKADLRVDGISQVTHQWTSIETRGAKTFENIVQAFCRDILFYGMHLAKNMGFQIVLTCHDEIVAEVDEDSPLGVKELVECMTTAPPWASDFLLGAEGMESLYYTKG